MITRGQAGEQNLYFWRERHQIRERARPQATHALAISLSLHSYLATLSRRADLIGPAITLCTSTAVLVCTVIALLFLADYLRYDMSLPVALLFILAMLLLVAGLVNFLREIFIAKASLHIGPGTGTHGSKKRGGGRP